MAPTLFVSAAIHGDEINGVDIVRRLFKAQGLARSGWHAHRHSHRERVRLQRQIARYLPDRRI